MFKHRDINFISVREFSIFGPTNFTSINLENTPSTSFKDASSTVFEKMSTQPVENTLFSSQEVPSSSPLSTNLAQAHAVKKLRNGKTLPNPYEYLEERKVTDYSLEEEEDHTIKGELRKEEESDDRMEKVNEHKKIGSFEK